MTKLSTNIKTLRKEKNINQSQLADLLSISQTSVAHYEKGDRQPTIETLMKLSSIFEVSIDELIGNKITKQGLRPFTDKEEIIQCINDMLIKKKDGFFLEYLKDLYKHYNSHTIIEEFLTEVLYRVGRSWELGLLTEADEHYITNVIRKSIHVLMIKDPFKLMGRKAITLAVHAEQHTLGIEMVSAYLEENGIETLYLGNNVPLRSLNQLINDYMPDFLFISITLKDHINSLVTMLDQVNQNNLQIVIGGQAVSQARKNLSHNKRLVFLDNMDQLKELIQ
jgi:methanogenic corrinoid protein MtbC1